MQRSITSVPRKTDFASNHINPRLLGRAGLLFISVVISIMLLTSFARAELATSEEMQNVCVNWLTLSTHNNGAWAGMSNPEVIASSDIIDEGTVLAKCYSISPQGFVIVPALKDMPPIKAYSTESDLDVSAEDGFAALIREVLRDRFDRFEYYYGSLEAMASEKGEPLFDPANREAWERFAVNGADFAFGLTKDARLVGDSAGPLITTAWHQSAPFNNLCPMGDGSRCVVGCVATAAAQILWYHAWPPAGLSGRRYLWYGDNSCGGVGVQQFVSANFSDNYDWANTIPNWEEICYETGVAFSMHYGACGSGAYTSNASWIYPMYFGYKDNCEEVKHSDYLPDQWFTMLKQEIDSGRPVLYTIYRHAIVGDGWKFIDGQFMYHMNYGWGGGPFNAWYTLDQLYCPWDGCSPSWETMIRYIEPDRRAMFYADTIIGYVPMEVTFTGVSDRSVTGWSWDFGDGSKTSISNQAVTHTYETVGPFDVSLTVHSDSGDYTLDRTNYIYAVADSLIAGTARARAGNPVEVTIAGRNTLPIEMIKIPVEYGGDLALVFDSFSTAGCRTEYFELQQLIHLDPFNRRLTVSLKAPSFGYAPFLEPGQGDLVKLYFTLPPNAEFGQEVALELDGYSASYLPTINGNLFGEVHVHNEISTVNGRVTVDLISGDVNDDDVLNLLDILFLVSYLYNNGPDPVPFESGDYNVDEAVNLLDVLNLIEDIYE